jgi:hypothetical protein
MGHSNQIGIFWQVEIRAMNRNRSAISKSLWPSAEIGIAYTLYKDYAE